MKERDRIGSAGIEYVFHVGYRDGVAPGAQVQPVAAETEVDRHVVGDRRRQRHDLVAGGPDQVLHVGEIEGVAGIGGAEREGVVAARKVDQAAGKAKDVADSAKDKFDKAIERGRERINR